MSINIYNWRKTNIIFYNNYIIYEIGQALGVYPFELGKRVEYFRG
jgi:hypothetical protein